MFLVYDDGVKSVNVDKIVEIYIEKGTRNYSEVFFVEASLVNGENTIFERFDHLNEAKKYLADLTDKINNMLAESKIKTIVKEVPVDNDILD